MEFPKGSTPREILFKLDFLLPETPLTCESSLLLRLNGYTFMECVNVGLYHPFFGDRTDIRMPCVYFEQFLNGINATRCQTGIDTRRVQIGLERPALAYFRVLLLSREQRGYPYLTDNERHRWRSLHLIFICCLSALAAIYSHICICFFPI